MELGVGTGAAFIALIGWGFGDFLIQRATRRVGIWEALFVVSTVGAVGLTPFVVADLSTLTAIDLALLIAIAAMVYGAAVFDFAAMQKGKMSVVAPALALEVPVTAVAATVIIGESLTATEGALIVVLILGLALVSLRGRLRTETVVEAGVALALTGAVLTGLSNFLVGFGARETAPIIVTWVMSLVAAVLCGLYLVRRRGVRGFGQGWRRHGRLLAATGIVANVGWVAFPIAALHMPITIAVAISECYIAVAATLGFLLGGGTAAEASAGRIRNRPGECRRISSGRELAALATARVVGTERNDAGDWRSRCDDFLCDLGWLGMKSSIDWFAGRWSYVLATR